MKLNGVRININIQESKDSMLSRVIRHFVGFKLGHHRKIYVEISSIKKYTLFFGLLRFARHVRHKQLLGDVDWQMNKLYIYNRNNIPLASLFVKKMFEELGYECSVELIQEDGEQVEYLDEHRFLNTCLQFLEKEQMRVQKEQNRIETELSDVHKKLQALSGGSSPYRTLSTFCGLTIKEG